MSLSRLLKDLKCYTENILSPAEDFHPSSSRYCNTVCQEVEAIKHDASRNPVLSPRTAHWNGPYITMDRASQIQ